MIFKNILKTIVYMIVIPSFIFLQMSQGIALSQICAISLCLMHKTLLETLPIHWAASCVSTITY